jgi:hypothetical protein
MAKRNFNPGSIACLQWEMLLADAQDGLLSPQDEAVFTAHKSICPACAALFEEARRGREWLEFLSPEPEVPAGLLDKILAQTGPGQIEGFGLMPAGNVLPMPPVSTPAHTNRVPGTPVSTPAHTNRVPGTPVSTPAHTNRVPGTPVWQRPGFLGSIRRFAEPRLLMTAAMAFFSIALTLNLTGVRLNLSSLRLADLRPTAVRSFPSAARSYLERRLTMASTPVIRYYDHSRLVNEVQLRVRDLRRATEGQDGTRQKPKDAAPGESRQTPGLKQGGTRPDSPQQSGSPVPQPALNHSNDFLQTSLTFQGTARASRRLLNGTTGTAIEKRSTLWTA